MSESKPSQAGRQRWEPTRHPGIFRVHSRGCTGRACRCGYQASVYSVRDRKKTRKSFELLGEAKTWREDMSGAVREGRRVAATKTTVKQAAETMLAGMRDGTLKNRSGHSFKPSTTRRYELAVRLHIEPVLGHLKLSDVSRAHVKELVKRWVRAGMVASSVRNNLDPLRVIFREAIEDGQVSLDPIAGMKLPTGRGRRERVADRAEAQVLIDALDESDRALWACAFYGGLRRGELRALKWSDVDFGAGVIRVERGWDDEEGEQATKTEAGVRRVPLAGALRKLLVAYKLASRRHDDALVFGRTAELPFIPSTVRARALAAWKAENERRVKDAQDPEQVELLRPITLHEARHSAASYLIEAGLNDLELTSMIGHSDPRTTKLIYGHLFPDSSEKVAAKLDAYLAADGEPAAR